ncbi:MAG: hypothetical protein J3R72DRAFT_525235, partial [Linnemannia gamsii]
QKPRRPDSHTADALNLYLLALHGSHSETKANEESASITEPTDDELEADVDAQADGDDLGATVESGKDAEDVSVLNELSFHSPFCDLIKDLYGL